MIRSRRILTHGPEVEPFRVCLYVQDMGLTWAAMIVADAEMPPEPGTVRRLTSRPDPLLVGYDEEWLTA